MMSLVMTLLFAVFMTLDMSAQSIVSGDVTGTVTDPSGAVVPNATVTLKNLDTGATATTRTNGTGFYRFAFQKPGRYSVSVSQEGFQTVTQTVAVATGQSTTSDIKLSVGQSSQTVEVTAATPIVQTDNGNLSTTFAAKEIESIPNPGGDTSYVAQTAPGVVMNTGSGYGNFSSFGLPATSNLFTVNGNDNMDPYLNLNNSGATNLTLGANELQEATVVNNGYSGQYGRQAGSNVNYTTKSGSNEFHGNAVYWWNGRLMNANSWFNKWDPGTANGGPGTPGFTPSPRAFVNANQWAASIGGPIKKDKIFFFVDTEGLRAIVPTSQDVYIPSPAFQNYVLTSGLPGNGFTNSGAFYQNIFNLYNQANGAQNAVPATDLATTVNSYPGATWNDPGGCESIPTTAAAVPVVAANLGVTLPVYTGGPCLNRFRSTSPNFNREWILAGRVDFNVSDRDKLFLRYRQDKGIQATYTDPINPIWDANSNQPQYEGQLNYSRTFGNSVVNQFIASGSYYRAIFSPTDLAGSLALFPTTIIPNTMTPLGGENYAFPQGRNVTQYQFVDDLSMTKGAHTIKVGANYRRNDISNYIFGTRTSGLGYVLDMADFASGYLDLWSVRYPQRLSQPIALYTVGMYIQDQWRLTPHFKLDLSLRADHNSNPVCQTNCFSRPSSDFFAISHDPNVPYDQVIQTGQQKAFPETQTLLWQPRVGFAWSPFGNDSTVLRGGIGIFYDLPPATIVDRFARNSPGVNQFTLSGPLASTEVGNIFSQGQQYNQIFTQGFYSGQTYAQIAATAAAAGLPTFRGPDVSMVTGKFDTPQFQEWSLEVEQAMGAKTSLSLKYVGNHGIHIPIINAGVNAYCLACAPGFTGLPAAATDPRFRNVSNVTTNAVSNYNGLTASFQRKFSQIQFQFNYTWSHALDEVSNGGVLPYFANANQDSVLTQINPFDIRQNYSNADYDVRHNITANYMWDPGFKFNNGVLNNIAGGWTLGGTIFWHSGYPYTVFDSNATSYFGRNFASGLLTGTFLGGAVPNCERPDRSCLNSTEFANYGATGGQFGNTRRNQFRGPGFFDTDLTIMKNFKITERMRFGAGATAFNLFNHPNFANPIGDLASSNFGQIRSTVTPPTTPLGAFLPADISGRIIQLQARITF